MEKSIFIGEILAKRAKEKNINTVYKFIEKVDLNL